MFDTGVVLETVEQLRVDAAKCADTSTWSLSDTELVDTLVAAHRLEQSVAALKLHLIRQADSRGLAAGRHVRSTAAWLQALLLVDAASARQHVAQACEIDRHTGVDAALSRGSISVRHAAAITDALDALPAGDVPAGVFADAESALLEFAGEFAPAPLRRLGNRVLEHVAPELADRLDEALLRRQEQRAVRKRGLTLGTAFEGRVFIRGYLSVEDAAIVSAALDPLCVPRPGDERTPPQMRADALIDVCRLALRTTGLPDNGGEAPQVAVTIAYDPLTRAVSTGRLDNGDRLSAATARRLACDAQIVPIVLGGSGQVLDAGRARRLATGALRRALVVRDGGCAFPSCDRPPRWCDAHHVLSWTAGGPTNLSNMILLCRHHHRLIHHGDWTARIATDGLPEFLPPTTHDPTQQPRRNRYHRRT